MNFKLNQMLRGRPCRRDSIIRGIIYESNHKQLSLGEFIRKRQIKESFIKGKENVQMTSGDNKYEKISPQENIKIYSMSKLGSRVLAPLHIGKPNILIGTHPFFPITPSSYLQQHYRSFYSTARLLDKRKPIKTDSNNKVHDYIVVGAGSAGCVLANRLSSNDKNTVHLVEAGPTDNCRLIKMPDNFTKIMCAPEFNWDYNSKVQPQLNNRRLYYPRGKVLGGSSSLNAMVYMRGHPFDYDRWEKEGATGWSYGDCLPYFKKSQSHESGENLYRGGHGPMKVSQSKVGNVLHPTWIKAGLQAGYSYTEDFNGYKQEGFGEYNHTIHNGIRWSTSKAYLEPALKRRNLTVTTNALATKVLFEGKRAIGIEILNERGQLEKIMAAKEVILSGGSINSPQLLMLSGVGNGDELKQHSIDVVEHVPGVGKNLEDHPALPVQHKSKTPIARFSQQSFFKKNKYELQWSLFKTGFGTSSHLDSGGYIRSEPGVPHPDIQLLFTLFLLNDHGRQPDPFDAFEVIISPSRSKSKGSISLQSNDPRQHPIIDLNYCSLERDYFEFRQGIRYSREIFAQPAFDEFRGIEITPGPELQTDSELNKFIKNSVEHIYHATSTCKMGSTKDSEVVVDPQCRVVGLDSLRVVDASIMPSIISGNTNNPTIMIAEKASDIILGNTPLPKMENVPIWVPKFPHQQRE